MCQKTILHKIFFELALPVRLPKRVKARDTHSPYERTLSPGSYSKVSDEFDNNRQAHDIHDVIIYINIIASSPAKPTAD